MRETLLLAAFAVLAAAQTKLPPAATTKGPLINKNSVRV
jgi:hypothetical protein